MRTLLIRAVGQEQNGFAVMNMSLYFRVLSVNCELFQCMFEFRSSQIKIVA